MVTRGENEILRNGIFDSFIGALGRIRTLNLLIRSQTLYPVELRARSPAYLAKSAAKRKGGLRRRQGLFLTFTVVATVVLAVAAAVIVGQAFDIVLAQVIARLHFDDREIAGTGIFQRMGFARRDIGRLVFF